MITKNKFEKWTKKMIAYYKNIEPFDKEMLMIDTLRLSSPIRLFRVLYSCSYIGMNDHFAGGVITNDILKTTGWKLPKAADMDQIRNDKIMSKKLEAKCRKYICSEELKKICNDYGFLLPVEWRIFYIMHVPSSVFTNEELHFMKNNPCWLLDFLNNNQD